MKKNRGAISIFALLSMMFFLIFIIVAYNNVTQKGKNQVKTEELLVDYYSPAQSATEVISEKNGGEFKGASNPSVFKEMGTVSGNIKANENKYFYSNGKFYKNTGEYQQVEYIEFTGTQYIDTDIIPSNHTIEIRFNFGEYNNDEHLFGTDYNAKYCHFTTYNNKYYWGTNGTEYNGGSWSTGIHTLLYNGQNNSVVLDGATLDSGKEITSPPSSNKLFIGRRSSTANLKAIIYYMKITDKSTGNLVRNFVPCYRTSDNVIGMYDTVNDVFYTNPSGTGTFLKGPNVGKYQMVEYLQSSGTQYIDTGYKPTPKTGIETKFQFTDLTLQQRVYGCDNSNGVNSSSLSYSLYINGNSQFAYAYQNGHGNWVTSGKTVDTNVHSIEFNTNPKGYWNIDFGNTLTSTKINGSPTNTALENMIIMASNRDGSGVADKAKLKLFKFRIYEDGVLKRDFVPCRRLSDNVLGLLDTVSGEFKTNAGSGTFTAGPDV